jgi:phosphoribosylamine--glycine ligase/phosphoribosylformylglycinamidine cyclo-ligase
MKILVVGSGGREHALAWKLAQSPHKPQLYIAPGNAGTAACGENVAIAATNVSALVRFAQSQSVDLIVVGPEAALEAGLADAAQHAGIRVFGPSQAAARIETSKAFSKDFMARHHIPTARYAAFSAYPAAESHLARVGYPVVIKTSGLAAGKGVIVPETRHEALTALKAMLVDRRFGSAAAQVIIEERLEGEEVTLLAFCDGKTARLMPPAQDHKRIFTGDQGPNTGGMGAYAPAPVLSAQQTAWVMETVVQPALDGMRAEGCPFKGILYTGLMLTPSGIKVLEFNCRFGDPEAQVVLPLLQTDLLDVITACIDENLDSLTVKWHPGAAGCVVLASEGYPAKSITGRQIYGLEKPGQDVVVFHAGTRLDDDGQVVTAGGRVLNITGTGDTIPTALDAAYRGIQSITFAGMQYRTDIGYRVTGKDGSPSVPSPSAYAASGVNIDAGNRAVRLMKAAVHSTYTPQVLSGIGSFGGLFDATPLVAMRSPVLVASTDGIGTKVRLGAAARRYEPLGMDIVNHCINDILVQGARPIFFLDYFATSRLDPEVVSQVVSGIAAACRAASCALLGGETAEMPGVYTDGEFDIAGTIIGVVERDRILPRVDVHAGDLIVGLRSDGPHTNGFSLIRKIIAGLPLNTPIDDAAGGSGDAATTLEDALLAPHRSYLPLLAPLLDCRPSPVKALAHLTGGGFIENIPRVLPEGLRAVVRTGSWPVPPLYPWLMTRGQVDQTEMYRVFNMGIGMVAIIAPHDLPAVQSAIPEDTWVIGVLEAGEKGVRLT